MSSIVKYVPLEDKKRAVEYLVNNIEFSYTRENCIYCNQEIKILKSPKQRTLTCPHCERKFKR